MRWTIPCLAAISLLTPALKAADAPAASTAPARLADGFDCPVGRDGAKNYYVARFNPLEDNFRLYKVLAGKRIQLATVGA